MTSPVRPDPPGLPYIVTRDMALAAGLTAGQIDHRVASGRWRVLLPGRYQRVWESPSFDRPFQERDANHRALATAAALARPGSVVGLTSAALLLGLPLFSGTPSLVTLLVSHRSWTGVRDPIVSRRARLDPHDITVVEFEGVGLVAVTTVTRTVFDIARTCSLGDALAVGDQALREGRLDEGRLAFLLESSGAMRGIARARRAVDHIDGRRESPLESGSAAHFNEWAWPEPRLQTEFFDSRGFVARTDFDWEAYGLVGEADGDLKYTGSLAPTRKEKWREARLRAIGKITVRWGWFDAAGDGHVLYTLLHPFLFPP